MFMQGEIQKTNDETKDKSSIEVEMSAIPRIEIDRATSTSLGIEEEEQVIDEDSFDRSLDLRDYSLARDRQRRKIIPPSRYGDSNSVAVALNVAHTLNDLEPQSFLEAVSGKNAEKWIDAMNEEMTSLEINKT